MKKEVNITKKIIGVDIGGTTIKAAMISYDGTILCHNSTPTKCGDNGELLCADIVALINDLIFKQNVIKSEIVGVGIGCPGLIDSQKGIVVFAGNLQLKYCPLASKVSDSLGLPVKITNDANAAALGEAKFGAGKKYKDSILITLGTGVGGGIVIDGKLFEGGSSAGTEIGHTVIVEDGEPCTCGRRGCFEAYSSATALMRKTRTIMQENKDSAMWNTYNLETVLGKTAFDYADTDKAAKSVVDWYVKYLACGVTNLANVFRPQVIMLGGGVSEQKERLTQPVQDLLDKQIFAGTTYAGVKVVTASLGNEAGVYGAAALMM